MPELAEKSVSEKPESVGNIKETIESILVAFILAFVFRAFVVEAFVIPTGSMAPTLLGAACRLQCPDCGYRFTFNVSGNESNDDIDFPSTESPAWNVYCPNCGDLVASRTSPPLGVNYGDRILVLKYAYLLAPPKRWDVVVFKSPAEPNKYHYAQNYIKRLVGLPGEQLMVLDGDLYVWNSTTAQWDIQVKPPTVQDALWRIVYNNDFYPVNNATRQGPPWQQPWHSTAGAGWNISDPANPRVFHFDNTNGAGAIEFDPAANSTTQTFNDFLVYDTDPHNNWARRAGSHGSVDDEHFNTVSDLKLSAYYQRASGDGPFRLKLSRYEKFGHIFTAEVTPDSVRLLHSIDGVASLVGEVKLADLGLEANSPMLIDLVNADYHVTVRINGKENKSLEVFYPPDHAWLMTQWRNRTQNKMPEASIEAEKQSATVTHLSLWHDIYYTNRSGGGDLNSATPENPAKLNPREYFVMGDNSLVSSDARYWRDSIDLPHEGLEVDKGRVPEQFLLGKAVFVYWPAGYRPFDPSGPAVVPNFGDMRWIH